MSVEIAWKQNILVTDFHLLKSLLVVFGFGSQAFICGFSRQNINSVFLILSTLWFFISFWTLLFFFYWFKMEAVTAETMRIKETTDWIAPSDSGFDLTDCIAPSHSGFDSGFNLTLSIPDFVTWRSCKGWFRPWPVFFGFGFGFLVFWLHPSVLQMQISPVPL